MLQRKLEPDKPIDNGKEWTGGLNAARPFFFNPARIILDRQENRFYDMNERSFIRLDQKDAYV